jgi:hypothetical protein
MSAPGGTAAAAVVDFLAALGRRDWNRAFPVLGLLHVSDGKLTEGWFGFDTGTIAGQLDAGPL